MTIPMLSLPSITPVSQSILRAQQINQAQAQTRALDYDTQLKQQQAQQQAALRQLTKEAFNSPQGLQALAQVSPERAQQVQTYQANQDMVIGRIAQGFDMLDIDQKEKNYPLVINQLKQLGISTQGLPSEYDPDLVDSRVKLAISKARDIEKQIGSRQILETAQGTVAVNPMTGQAMPVQMGGQQLSPYIKPPSTQINIDTKAEGKEKEELAKLRAKRYGNLLESGETARRAVETLEVLRQAVSSPAASQGAFAGLRVESKRMADLFGFNVEGLEDDAIIASVGNKLALQLRNPKGEDGGLTGATSDRDLRFLVASVPNRDKTQTQNLALIEIGLRDKQRTVQLAEFADQYLQETGSLKGLERAKKEWLENHPLYPEGAEKDRIKQMLKGEGIRSGQVGNIKWRLK